ncbi:DNA helicase-2 / ATP-dependent DNA helicase PcrA [Paenibacillus sp. UNC496MF]|uniref:RNA polymerase recycling motor HelD n=1 Tax=Paenibacillus sp. UNC496MF TaxID=1502753 RepID=UPI0008E4FEBB|nr:RNA polymerase recycling motor HelD [Paenibacillus sp. UNC496MF]SFI51074.1 DNA helicase-2 / ATP-dependent DNA helicase PcrA [Paenibacillus sp. UNC496MF]
MKVSEREPEWTAEQRRVDEVVRQVDRSIEALELQTSGTHLEMVDIRKNFWDDVTVNFEDSAEMAETFASLKQQAEILSERERTHGHAARQLKTLRKLKSSPYFGRIDFLENGEAQADRVYLGIASLRDRADEHYLIYDWRAPIASLYYDYPPGPAELKTPSGLIEGELLLKRQFVIREGEIVSLFDTGVTIGDELLQEVLGRQSDAQMRSIVGTIQREQNRIIRNERSRLLLVQGAAGSGKTSAALQRVAYLLYRYRGTLNADQIVLFSPNPMFNSYVSTVLPELGEENMQQTTFQDYLAARLGHSFKLENPYAQLEYALRAELEPGYGSRMEGIRYKATTGFVRLIDGFLGVLGREGLVFRDVRFREETLVSGEAIGAHFYGLDRSISVPNRMRLTAEWLLRLLKERQKTARTEPWVDGAVELLDKETYLKAYQTLRRQNRQLKDESFDDFDRERELLGQYVVMEAVKPTRTRIKKLTFVDVRSTFLKLFLDSEMAAAAAAQAGIELPGQWEAICKDTIDRLLVKKMAYEDATPFLYVVERIRGFQTNTSVRHVLIDEAQDYTAFQFAYLQRLFPFSRITALGDLNQSIQAHASEEASTGFTALASLYASEETETIVLRQSYRSTRPIVEFTSKLIPDGDRIEPFNRGGDKPVLTVAADSDALNGLIEERLAGLAANGNRTIAVICKTGAQSKAVYEALRDRVPLRLVQSETSTFEPGIVVIPSYLAKGVEFDAVLVYDASGEPSGYGEESERRLFYTVCTRAMHELHLFALGTVSPFLKGPIEDYYANDSAGQQADLQPNANGFIDNGKR